MGFGVYSMAENQNFNLFLAFVELVEKSKKASDFSALSKQTISIQQQLSNSTLSEQDRTRLKAELDKNFTALAASRKEAVKEQEGIVASFKKYLSAVKKEKVNVFSAKDSSFSSDEERSAFTTRAKSSIESLDFTNRELQVYYDQQIKNISSANMEFIS